MTRPFRFGVYLDRVGSREDFVNRARTAESIGYSTILVQDHVMAPVSPIPAMMTVAETTSLRITSGVLANDFRHPVMLARDAATMDVLTDGRLELGLGAGWLRTDYEQSGIPYASPRVRVERLEETMAILKGYFSGEPFSFEGMHYRVNELQGSIRPVQQPHPPLLLGGGGPRILRPAAREANIAGVFYNLRSGGGNALAAPVDGTTAATLKKIELVREEAGDRFDQIELMLHPHVEPTRDRVAWAKERAATFVLEAEQVLDDPFILAGTPEQICEQLLRQRSTMGFSFIAVREHALHDMAPVIEALAGR